MFSKSSSYKKYKPSHTDIIIHSSSIQGQGNDGNNKTYILVKKNILRTNKPGQINIRKANILSSERKEHKNSLNTLSNYKL